MSEAFKENCHTTDGPPTTRPANQGADVERITILEQNNNKLEEKMKFLIEVTETIYRRLELLERKVEKLENRLSQESAQIWNASERSS